MSEEKHTPLSDTIHNLKVVREALEAEGLTVHVKLIDQAIEDISAPQAVQLPPIPIHWARPKGDTFDEMRDNVWKTGLATGGDTILIWVNEGDFLHAQIVFGAVEYPQLSHNTQAGSAWQTIETAPQDGSEILILTSVGITQARFAPGEWHNHPEGREYDGPVWVCCDDQWQIEIEDCGEHGINHGTASHWMPCPTTPSRPPRVPSEKIDGDQ